MTITHWLSSLRKPNPVRKQRSRRDRRRGVDHSVSHIERLEDRTLLSAAADLPAGGGTFEVVLDGGDVIVREQGGDEIFRDVLESVTDLTVNGSADDDTLIVDFSSGSPIPSGGLTFNGGEESTNGDTLQLTGGNFASVNHIFTNAGDDEITLADNGVADDGISRISSATSSETATGGRAVDFRNPTGKLFILADDGDDTVTLLGTDSQFTAEIRVRGQAGDDLLDASAMTREVTLAGAGGRDTLLGGTAGDLLIGQNGPDEIDGGDGHDLIRGEGGDDVLFGRAGNDELLGGQGNDTILGGDGDDTIRGQSEDDFLLGEAGVDSVGGSSGDDTVAGGGNGHPADPDDTVAGETIEESITFGQLGVFLPAGGGNVRGGY